MNWSLMRYDSTTRRRARVLRRMAEASVTPRLYPTAPVIAAYWWDGHHNFGDALTPWLLHRYGKIAVHTPPHLARMVGVGSILEQLPQEFRGTVWGSGLLFGQGVDLPNARFAAVRGRLTKDVLGIREEVALGDPGLLVSRYVTQQQQQWVLGIVPHGMHNASPVIRGFAGRYPREVTVIDTAQSVDAVVRKVARCAAVLSTSLHGLVMADAIGIPAAWFELEPRLWGGDFKFRDYESVVTPGSSRRIELTQTSRLRDLTSLVRRPSADCISKSVEELEASLERIEAVQLPPFLARKARRDRG